MDRTGPRPGRISAGPVAGYYRAFVLQLSRDGRTRHNFHCCDGLGCVAVVAGETLRLQTLALGAPSFRFPSPPPPTPPTGGGPTVGAYPPPLSPVSFHPPSAPR